jgi:hypothetical protein
VYNQVIDAHSTACQTLRHADEKSDRSVNKTEPTQADFTTALEYFYGDSDPECSDNFFYRAAQALIYAHKDSQRIGMPLDLWGEDL